MHDAHAENCYATLTEHYKLLRADRYGDAHAAMSSKVNGVFLSLTPFGRVLELIPMFPVPEFHRHQRNV